MRVGFVTGEYPPMEGGVGAFTRELGRAIADAGHEVFVHTRLAADAAAGADPGIMVQATVERWGWGTSREVRAWAAPDPDSPKGIRAVSIPGEIRAIFED